MIEKVKEMIEEMKKETSKACYALGLDNENQANITDTKLGGAPYTPEGEEFVKSGDGSVMALFVQINFEQINLENYPKKGILQLLINDAYNTYPTEYKIKYYEDISKPSRTDYPEVSEESNFVTEEIKLKLTKSVDFMPFGDFRFNALFSEMTEKYLGKEIDFYDIEDETGYPEDDLYSAFHSNSGNIGGYADFTQSDPRYYEDDLKDKTECIFKIDSILDFHRVVIGDSGIAWLMISEEDLKNKNFEKALFDWDCC